MLKNGIPIHLTQNFLPPSLQHASFSSIANVVLEASIHPEGLLEFEVETKNIIYEIGSLPSSLRTLGLTSDFDRSLTEMSDIFATLPNLSTLVVYKLRVSNGLSVNTIPTSVKCIK